MSLEPVDTSDGKRADLRIRVITSALTAVAALVFLAELRLLPPIANTQLASATEALRKPVATVIATAAVATVVGLELKVRFAVAFGLLALSVCAAASPLIYYSVTTKPGRSVSQESANWPSVQLTSREEGTVSNRQNVLGRATLRWKGDDFRLSLRSETGTTQQGIYWDAGGRDSSYVFKARVFKQHGGRVVTCPLLFGIVDNRTYDTFRLQNDDEGHAIAAAYEIRPKGPQLTSGFKSYTLDETGTLPYVNTWNVITPSEQRYSKLMIHADGNYYEFYVNNRRVFSRRIPGKPIHRVAIGTTVLANDYPSQAVCDFHDVSLKVAP